MDTLKTCSGEKISSVSDWVKNQIKQEEIDKYLENNHDFIDDAKIKQTLQDNQKVSKERIRGILEKAHEINLMDDADVAALVNVTDPDLIDYYIYQTKAVQMRYRYLLNCAKKLEDSYTKNPL